MVISPGSSIGPYLVLSSIGTGGMGEVYRAQDPRLGREIALKVIRRSNIDQDDALDRLLREAALASSLNHPNIVTIYDTGVCGSGPLPGNGAGGRRDAADALGAGHPRSTVRSTSRARSLKRSLSRMWPGSSTAISSRTTSWCGPTATSSCSTSASPVQHDVAATLAVTGHETDPGMVHRDGGLYGARTGTRRDRRARGGHLRIRRRALRDGHREASVPRSPRRRPHSTR